MIVLLVSSLAGKVAVVTGAARGIGRAGALALAREGASVVGVDIAGMVDTSLQVAAAAADVLADTGRLVESYGGPWIGIALDQRDIGAVLKAAEQVGQSFGGLDILFANAGVQAFKPLLEVEDADWHTQIDVNLSGTANVLRVFAPMLVKRGGGRIIVTSSTQGRQGTKFGCANSASKWGLIGLIKSAALELAVHRITVNALIPGLIDTPLTRYEGRYAQALQAVGKTPSGNEAKDEDAAKESLIAKTPLGIPWIEPDDVSPVVTFLAQTRRGWSRAHALR